jgi:hypothetical protein
MRWPKGKYGDRYGGWGNTFEEYRQNTQRAMQEAGQTSSGIAYDGPITDEQAKALIKQLAAVNKALGCGVPRRRKPVDAPPTKKQQAKWDAMQRRRAKSEAEQEKRPLTWGQMADGKWGWIPRPNYGPGYRPLFNPDPGPAE